MNERRSPLPLVCSVFVIAFTFHPLPVFFPFLANAEEPSGIQPLRELLQSNVHALISDPAVRPLLTSSEQERFLKELENQPPEWDQMHDPPGEERGTRLFALNRRRDDLRNGHPLLKQRVAFVWSGALGEYHEKHKGYSVVLGPHPTQTSWGTVRFKPTGFPHEMVAVPSTARLRTINNGRAQGEQVEIGILFTGTLIPWESIIYGFSHDGLEQGMVMPVVQVEGVQYFVKDPGASTQNTL